MFGFLQFVAFVASILITGYIVVATTVIKGWSERTSIILGTIAIVSVIAVFSIY